MSNRQSIFCQIFWPSWKTRTLPKPNFQNKNQGHRLTGRLFNEKRQIMHTFRYNALQESSITLDRIP